MSKHLSGPEGSRPLSLGKRVSRIAERLAGGATDVAGPPAEELVGRVIHARHLRFHYFPENLFGEPAWEVLLELLQAQIEGRTVTVTALSEAAGTPGSVTLRWLNLLVGHGLVRRQPDPHDSLTELVELEPVASEAMRRYFDALSRQG